jgi:2-polyprenyl-3-methyl-5-hydroxy-6-metoxy-1,4-benzoquinol methylase
MAITMPVVTERNSMSVLDEQQTYYRERAAEYDEWWLRTGRYDHGDAFRNVWFAEVAEVYALFDAADLTGDVLELAGGTGIWSERLARRAATLTVLDGAPEMIAINRARLERAGLVEKVTYRQADLFAWQPERQYDGVFFGFWLSHVPPERTNSFLDAVASALRPGGTLGIIDSRREQESTADNQPLQPEGELIQTRYLNDGRKFEIVKRYYSPNELTDLLARHGIDARVETTATHFLTAVGRRR